MKEKARELVSVIVPIYKAEKSLHKCVNSILSQTHTNIEVVLVDDGSPDGCPRICDELSATDKRIVVIHKKNGGVSSARNEGIQRATGNYLMFVDADDWLETNAVELLLDAIVCNAVDMAICGNFNIVNEEKTPVITKGTLAKSENEVMVFVKDNYLRSIVATPWGKLYKKEYVDSFLEGMSFGEDLLFNVKYFEKIKSLVLIENPLYNYKIDDTAATLTNSFSIKHFDYFEILYRETLNYLCQKGRFPIKELTEVNYKFFYASLAFMKKCCIQNSKKETLNYIGRLCKSELLRTSAKALIGKKGFKITVACLLTLLKMKRLIYSYIKSDVKKRIKKQEKVCVK